MKMVHKLILAEIVGVIIITVMQLCGITRPANVPPINVTVIGAAAVPIVQATVYSAPWCQPCKPYIGGTKQHRNGIKDEMPGDGWVIKDSTDKDAATAHIVINQEEAEKQLKADGVDVYPTTIIKRNGKQVKRFTGAVTPEDLANAINEAAK